MEGLSRKTEVEPRVIFKSITDKICFSVVNEEHGKELVNISGYDLDVSFNLEYMNSVEDVEMAVEGIANLFRELIMDSLLKNKHQP